MSSKFLMALTLTVAITVTCSFLEPEEPDLATQQYDFAVQALDAYFIFRDKLPADLYAFTSPKDLYTAVDEPYTGYYNRDEAASLMSMLSTRSGGIGIRIDSVKNGYLLKDVFKNSPGESAGLAAGDTIVSVNGIPVAGVEWKSFTQSLSGEIGTKVILVIRRNDGDHTYTITRGEYIAPSVFIDSVNEQTASIMLTGFLVETNNPEGTFGEFKKALDSTRWALYTIIDLRGNGGGYIDQCVDITGLMVDSGTSMIRYKERTLDENGRSVENADTLKTDRLGSYSKRKFYLLTDGNTASASEIMVSCLMQRENVTIVGDTTFGKARGQVILFGPDSVLAKVTCLTFIPVGGLASYDLVGIVPDHLADTLDAFDVALQVINALTVPAKRRSPNNFCHPARFEKPLQPLPPTALMR